MWFDPYTERPRLYKMELGEEGPGTHLHVSEDGRPDDDTFPQLDIFSEGDPQ